MASAVPHLIKGILIIEHVQYHAIKCILNDYASCYKTWLIKLKLFPLMCLFKLHDILFAIKSTNIPTIQFNITNYINISSTSTRSDANNILILPHHLNNILDILIFTDCHLYRTQCLCLIWTWPSINSNQNWNQNWNSIMGTLLESFWCQQ